MGRAKWFVGWMLLASISLFLVTCFTLWSLSNSNKKIEILKADLRFYERFYQVDTLETRQTKIYIQKINILIDYFREQQEYNIYKVLNALNAAVCLDHKEQLGNIMSQWAIFNLDMMELLEDRHKTDSLGIEGFHVYLKVDTIFVKDKTR